MADERYQWLDQDAAERLLRGEPVDAVDDHSRAEAERLAQALAAARPHPVLRAADAELPGEAAALAAFRKAAAERGRAVRPAAHTSHAVAELDAVRITRAHGARSWGRSLRYGLAAAVAAVAVGGVAVASGTGMLPFTTDGPTPAGSVSAADTPGPIASNSPDSSPSPGPHADTGTPSAPPAGDSGSASPETSSTPPAIAGPGGTGASEGPGGKGDVTPEPGTSGGPADQGGDPSRDRLVKACKDFRAGRIDDTAKDRLAKSARDGETVRRFCDRLLGGKPTSSGGNAGGEGDEDSSGEGDRTGSEGRGDGESGQWGDWRDDARRTSALRAPDLAPDRARDLVAVASMNTV
ncbi:hypothetical protein Q5762_10475 [Streptomyces sp. P9(2023)]|uniref:hypothetical protein n=1 Tax=Streptomyces sp. P9(2023) TaxID=3064394 RepID=UPI0028F45CF7|nr:hypothetical protein [Streptomyces sp. P9(2023)]MDT9688776.1 hypothetical protein [Streptomyces sp. P9(2023)]